MPVTSAGILLHRERDGTREVLLVHPGGPFFAKKDLGAWSIPKGELEPGEDAEARARIEFTEELGAECPAALTPIGEIRQKAGKVVIGFAAAGDFDPATLTSNTFEIEWPPRSGTRREFPEVDRAEWFTLEEAATRINAAQAAFLERLQPSSD
jgi:predicted NUDIX family NTP pyrophosphohydrolase